MAQNKKSRAISRWVRRNQNKHLCQCGCGEYIVIKREHYKPKTPIPKYIKGHNLRPARPLEEVAAEQKKSSWDKLSPEEQQRRLSQLKSFKRGEKNPAWKGGRRVDENGYIRLLMPTHKFSRDGYVGEHRLIVENRLKEEDSNSKMLVDVGGVKYLDPNAVVHHIDEVKANNSIDNLMLLPMQKFHSFLHFSPLDNKEVLYRIARGISHSKRLTLEEESYPVKFAWILKYIPNKED